MTPAARRGQGHPQPGAVTQRSGSLPDQVAGTLQVEASQLEAVNRKLAVPQADRRSQLALLEGPEGGFRLSTVDQAGLWSREFLTTWYKVSADGRSWTLLACRRQPERFWVPLLLSSLATYGPLLLLTRVLRRDRAGT